MQIIDLAEKAGEAVMEIYSKNDLSVTYKEDYSPVTLADRTSHQLITGSLHKLTPEIPVLSEESRFIPYKERRYWKRYWLVDPLDGTKEFIKRNGEFTINIALIENRTPVFGVVHAPLPGITYYARQGNGAFKKENNEQIKKITVSDYKGGILKIVVSRSHKGERLENFLRKINSKINSAEYISMGSSLKLCLVAEGRAHIYPRLGPTMEWDTAAAQCIVEEAGGIIVDMAGRQLRYNKEDLSNKDFVVSSSRELLEYILNKEGE